MSTFKAYLITPEAGAREYETARDRAVARAREVGGSFDLVDLPATKAGLIPFLNAREREIVSSEPADAVTIEFERPPMPAFAPPPARLSSAPAAPAVGDVSAMIEWIYDSASQSQIEQIFTALGVRFGEKIRPERMVS